MHSYRKILLALLILSISITVNIPLAQKKEIVFAISPMASPVSNIIMYNDFIDYLSEKIGYKVIIKQRRKYSDINALLETGEAHFALTCTGAFLSGKNKFGLEVLAMPVMNGKTSYHSYIIVHRESEIDEFRQLHDKVFAFTDPLSLSGRLYPLSLLRTLGIAPNEFFSKSFYTSSHEKSILSVANSLADGAAVDSLIFDNFVRTGSPVIDRIKVIRTSPPYGIPPVVASPQVEKTAKQRMSRALIKMAEDPAAKEILDRIMIERFILPEPAIYHTAEKLRQALLTE